MFVQVLTPSKDGELIKKQINLLCASVIHDINPDDAGNKGKFRSVIFMPNGYAAYSYLTADQLVKAVQGSVVPEQDIINKEAVSL